jgi:predicted DNA-binding WGR domain protein
MPTFINKIDQSNKFWRYSFLAGNEVKVEWGRIGLAGQSQIKNFNSSWERQRYIEKMVAEKTQNTEAAANDLIPFWIGG